MRNPTLHYLYPENSTLILTLMLFFLSLPVEVSGFFTPQSPNVTTLVSVPHDECSGRKDLPFSALRSSGWGGQSRCKAAKLTARLINELWVGIWSQEVIPNCWKCSVWQLRGKSCSVHLGLDSRGLQSTVSCQSLFWTLSIVYMAGLKCSWYLDSTEVSIFRFSDRNNVRCQGVCSTLILRRRLF